MEKLRDASLKRRLKGLDIGNYAIAPIACFA